MTMFRTLLAICVPGLLGGADAVIHVSTTGSDTSGDGSFVAPFATPGRAQDAARALRASSAADSAPPVVQLRPGTYHLPAPLAFTADDDGSVYEPLPGFDGEVILSAGQPLPPGAPVSDPAVLSQLPAASASSVRVVDLTAPPLSLALTDLGAFSSRGSPNANAHLEMHAPMLAPSGLELYWATNTMERRADFAAFPPSASGANLAFDKMGAVDKAAPAGEAGFALSAAAAQAASTRWAPQLRSAKPDIWGHGFWQWAWADAHFEVTRLDDSTEGQQRLYFAQPPIPGDRQDDCATLVCCGDCQIAEFSGQAGAGKFFVYNLLSELDEPNEVYLNRSSGQLFFIPPAATSPGGDQQRKNGTVSMLENVVTVRSASNVTLRGLTLSHARGIGLLVEDATGLRVTGGGVRSVGSTGVNITRGADCVLSDVTVNGVGDTGVVLDGGDRTTLVPAGHALVNSNVFNTNYYVWANAPNVFLGGVGQALRGSELSFSTHQAVWVQGNDHVISGCDIHDVLQATTDSGAVYAGRDWTYRGNLVVHNRFHDLRSHVGEDTSAVYMDDCMSGFNISFNDFTNISRALLLGGGRDVIFVGNTINGSHAGAAVHFDSRCKGGGSSTATQMARLARVPYNTSSAWAKYGDRMVHILAESPEKPSGNHIDGNVFCGGKSDMDMPVAQVEAFNSTFDGNTDCQKSLPAARTANVMI